MSTCSLKSIESNLLRILLWILQEPKLMFNLHSLTPSPNSHLGFPVWNSLPFFVFGIVGLSIACESALPLIGRETMRQFTHTHNSTVPSAESYIQTRRIYTGSPFIGLTNVVVMATCSLTASYCSVYSFNLLKDALKMFNYIMYLHNADQWLCCCLIF